MFTCIECENTYRDTEGDYDERICNDCMDMQDEGNIVANDKEVEDE